MSPATAVLAVTLGRPDEVALSLAECAKRLPYSEWQVRQLVRRGILPATKLGRNYFVFESDVLKTPLKHVWQESA